jgi:F0F1-type ATP synthase delta subunit
MKYPANIYGKALAEAIVGAKEKDGENIVKNFLALVRRNGDEPFLKKILAEADRFVREAEGIRKVTAEFAREPQGQARTFLKAFMKPGDVLEEHIDPRLIAGVKITVDDDMQLDGSLKGKLDKLFGAL